MQTFMTEKNTISHLFGESYLIGHAYKNERVLCVVTGGHVG